MTNTETIVIKGTRDGLQVTLGEGEFDELLLALDGGLNEKGSFFEGARVILQVGARALGVSQLHALQALLARHNMTLWAVIGDDEDTRGVARQLGLATRLRAGAPPPEAGPAGSTVPAFLRSGRELDGSAGPAPAPGQPPPGQPPPGGPAGQPPVGPPPGGQGAGSPAPAGAVPLVEDGVAGVFVRRTLRSGKSVRYSGAVLVLGDVNPGAEIVAGGDVIVWGKLRGVVHAGAMGDEHAVVCALELAPTQLRIAGRIAIAPDDRRRRRQITPEIARIRDGHIVAEGWKA